MRLTLNYYDTVLEQKYYIPNIFIRERIDEHKFEHC